MVNIVNPIPEALHHYQQELEETLKRISVDFAIADTCAAEGRRGMHGKIAMVRAALSNARRFRGTAAIQLWPSLGLAEARLWEHGDFVIFHDPIPIRPQFGYGTRFRSWANGGNGKAPTLITHSRKAAAIVESTFPRHEVRVALHPVQGTEFRGTNDLERQGGVLVAGQYKPERDTDLLEQLAPKLAAIDMRGRIVGRGWPEVTGWDVHSAFVSESELDTELSRAQVVLVPYRNYFQSGIAIRALELGTPVALLHNDFAESLLGEETPMIRGDATAGAVIDVISQLLAGPSAHEIIAAYRSRVDESWQQLFGRATHSP